MLNHPYRILILGGLGFDKNNVLLNLIRHQQPGVEKTYLHFKDPFGSKYQLLINRS